MSGYQQCWNITSRLPAKTGSSCMEMEEHWWTTVWVLKISPKVHIFLWKVTLDIISATANLQKHHVPTMLCCFACGAFEAITKHMHFFSPFVKRLWKELEVWRLIKHGKDLPTVGFLRTLQSRNACYRWIN